MTQRGRTIYFSGKGGVGKSTLSMAYASFLSQKEDVLHVDLSLTGHWTASYEPCSLSPRLWGCHLKAHDCLKDYVYRRVKIKTFVDVLLENEKIKSFFETAPGVEPLIILGRIFDLSQSKKYSTIIVDAPATGHGLALLYITEIAQTLFRLGPIHDQAQEVDHWVKSTDFEVYLVTLLEDLPISETREFLASLKAKNLRVGTILANFFPRHLPTHTDPHVLHKILELGAKASMMEHLIALQIKARDQYVKELKTLAQSISLIGIPEVLQIKFENRLTEVARLWAAGEPL